MIRIKAASFLLVTGLLFATNQLAQAQDGNKKKEGKEYKEKDIQYKGKEKEYKENRAEYRDKQSSGTTGDIIGRVIFPRRGTAGPRQLAGVPKGHYPPPGECRIWYPNRPAGHQPPPTSCENLRGIRLEPGAFILHGDQAYDAEYDWRREEERRPGSVGRDILDILFPRR